MTATEMTKGNEGRAIELASLRAELIKEAAGHPQVGRNEPSFEGRVNRKWWEFFRFPHA